MESSAYIIFAYILFFSLSVIFSFLINGLLLKFSTNLGIRNAQELMVRWSSQVKPSLGGISFYILFLFSIAGHSIFFGQPDGLMNFQMVGQIGAITLAFLMGLADDAYNTRPVLKFLVQLICGCILVSTGTSIQLFSNEILNFVLTVSWIIGIMNSINMLDNMDAITSVVSVFIMLSALLILSFQQNFTHIHFFLLTGGIATLAGFLYYNWHPSKIFMGDTGSQFLGSLLGIIGIQYFWNYSGPTENINIYKQVITVLLVFILPIIDTTIVVINRISRGQSPFIGGKDHTTHHLSYLGLSDNRIAQVYIIIGAVSLGMVYSIHRYIAQWNVVYFTYFIAYFVTLFSAFFYLTHKSKAPVKQPIKANVNYEEVV